ncbi:MAG: hypothetical protein ACYCOY_07030 [Metallibacterium sp.]
MLHINAAVVIPNMLCSRWLGAGGAGGGAADGAVVVRQSCRNSLVVILSVAKDLSATPASPDG